MTNEPSEKIILFRNKKIRRQFHNGEWWFVVEDIVAAVAETPTPSQYLKDMRRRDAEFAAIFTANKTKGGVRIEPPHENSKGGGQFAPPLFLPFDTAGGKQKLKSWNTEGIFRLIQSIPSKNAEPFKRWLAKIGYERIQEIENPELAQKRMKAIYKAKGYSDEWIERRVRGIAIRDELTDEWQKRGIQKQREYAILTSEISKATFGITPSEYKKLKGLKRENLRDHMNDLELLFAQLGEAATTEIARTDDSQGFIENSDAARRGGSVAGKARADLETQTHRKIVSPQNYKTPKQQPQISKLTNPH